MSSEWPKKRLSEISEVVTGFPFKGDMYLPPKQGIRVVRGDNVTERHVRWGEKEKCWTDVSADLKHYVLRAGDVVIGMDGSKVGKNFAAISADDDGALLAQRVARVRAREGVSQDYLRYLICNDSFTEYVKAVHTGTSIPHISKGQIEDFQVNAPPLKVQHAIAEILVSLDDRTVLLRETNSTLEAIAQALFKSLFIDFEPMQSKMAGRAHEGFNVVAAAECPNSVDDLQNFVSRPTASKLIAEGALLIGDGYRAKNNELGLPGVAFVRAGDLDGGQITPTKDFLARPALGAAASKMAKPGDTAFTSKGTIGRFAFVDAAAGDAVYSPQVCFWRSLDRHVIEPVYLHYWMKSAAFKNQVDAVRGQAAIMDYVSLSDQRKMKVDLPPIALQSRFAEVITPMLDRISCNRAAAMALSSIRDELVPRLISGQLRLPEAHEQLDSLNA